MRDAQNEMVRYGPKRTAQRESGSARQGLAAAAREFSREFGLEETSEDQERQRMFQKAHARAESARQDFTQAKARFEQLTGEIAGLEEELSDRDDAPSLNDVLAYQQKLVAAKVTVDSLQTEIEKQRELIASGESRSHAALANCANLESAYSDDLAAVVEGRAQQSDLKERELAIQQARQEAERVAAEVKPAADRARQTIIGLERRLQAATAELDRLAKMRPEVLEGFLLTIAEENGHEYYQLARKIIAVYTRLTALSMLMRDLVPNLTGDPIADHSHFEIFLPNFTKLAACDEHEHKNSDRRNMFSGVNFDVAPYAMELKNELRALGIDL